MNRKFHSWNDQGRLMERFFVFNFYVLAISALSIPIVFILKKYFGILSDIPMFWGISLSALSIYLNTWTGTLIPALNMIKNRLSFTIFTVVNLLGSLLASVLLIKIYSDQAIYWYLGQYVVFQLIVVVVSFFYLRSLLNTHFNPLQIKVSTQQLKNLARFCIPLGIATFFMWLLNDSYRFIVEKDLGLKELGILAVGITVPSSIFALLESLFQQVFYPSFYEKINHPDFEARSLACQDLIGIFFPVFFLASIYLSCAAPFLLKVLTSPTFYGSTSFVIFGVWISFFRVFTNVWSTIAHSELDTKKLIAPYALGGFSVLVGLYLFLAASKSSVTVGIVLLCSNFLVAIFMKHRMAALVRIHIPWRSILKYFFYAIPFFLQILFWKSETGILFSIGLMFIFGLYYLYIILIRLKLKVFDNFY